MGVVMQCGSMLNVNPFGGSSGLAPPAFCNASSGCSPAQFTAVIQDIVSKCGGFVPSIIRGSLAQYTGGSKALCWQDASGNSCPQLLGGIVDFVHSLLGGGSAAPAVDAAQAQLDRICQSDCLSAKLPAGISFLPGFARGSEIAQGLPALACSKDSQGSYCLLEYAKVGQLLARAALDPTAITKAMCSECLRSVSGRMGAMGLGANIPRFSQVCEDRTTTTTGSGRGCTFDALAKGSSSGLFALCDPRAQGFSPAACFGAVRNFSSSAGCCARQALPFIPDMGTGIAGDMGGRMPPQCTRAAGEKVLKVVVSVDVGNVDWDVLKVAWQALAKNITAEVAVVAHAEAADAVASHLDDAMHAIVVEFLPTGATYTAESVAEAVRAAVAKGDLRLSTINMPDFVLDPTDGVKVTGASASLEEVAQTESGSASVGVALGVMAVAALVVA
eukprot:m51a1_g4819 hypothetical protein (445) ;mRNA; r:154032-155366